MKKKIMATLLFLSITLVFLILSSAYFSRLSLSANKTELGRNSNIVGLARQKKNTLDILIIGDSESYTSISPLQMWKEHGYAAFTAGQSGQRMPEAYHILANTIGRQHLKLVILETHEFFNYSSTMSEMNRTLMEFFMNLFPVIRYHSLIKYAADSTPAQADPDFKGFIIREGKESYSNGDYMFKTSEKEKIHLRETFYFGLIRDLCAKNSIPLLLYSAPSPKNYTYDRHNTIQSFADSSSLTYLDLNLKTQDLKIDWQNDTMDKGDHLNADGAAKVTAFMGKYLQDNYSLPDHRNDEAYAGWNKDAEIYEQALASS